MSDALTARAIRDSTRTLVMTSVMLAVFVVAVLPITSVVVVHTAAKWQIEAMQTDYQRGLEKAAAERNNR